MRDILLPVINPHAYRQRKSLTLSHHATLAERAPTKLHQVSNSHEYSTNENNISSLGRTKSLSLHPHLRQQQQPAPPLLSMHQSKVDRLVKKLLKAGTDGDLGMVKFLLHWNQPPKAASSEISSVATKAKSASCHPLCDCDNCIKMVSIKL